MKILVTGGAGFIGSHLVDSLLKLGHQVTVLDNVSSGHSSNISSQCRLVVGDIRDQVCIDACLKGTEAVFHLAALTSVPGSIEDPTTCYEVNLDATQRLLEAVCAAGVARFIYASTSALYPDNCDSPLRETVSPCPKSPYAQSKLKCEELLRRFHQERDLSYAALRFFNVYGPRQDAQSDYAAVIPAFISAGRKQQALTINGDGRQTRDFVYVADVVRANLAAIDTAVCGVFNVGTAKAVSILSLAKTVNRLVGSPGGYFFAEPRPGDATSSTADIALISSKLGWTPRWRLQTGLATTVDWFVSQEDPPEG